MWGDVASGPRVEGHRTGSRALDVVGDSLDMLIDLFKDIGTGWCNWQDVHKLEYRVIRLISVTKLRLVMTSDV